MKEIKFSKNWNNKLDCDYFTTIRLYTPTKYKYYKDSRGEFFHVMLNGLKHSEAELISVNETMLNQIPYTLCYSDAGMKFVDFFNLMKSMYGKKQEWKEEGTIIIVLLFAKRTN